MQKSNIPHIELKREDIVEFRHLASKTRFVVKQVLGSDVLLDNPKSPRRRQGKDLLTMPMRDLVKINVKVN